ncbi:uncharacterized protein MONBRDRAFT_33118 [Monosiga brevicollis MX1]|uniref:Uncharacterized protein n=1 Tax=Monosiga brevicollis TaxID=81824 RepID=A9V3T1_MONBE|nr:uncharacterized protein MONBRDRAFT_33118 [Monosiga brevicollis MX1]EDQ87761.1 predicted protein [Monosiga brevicollis MX1]|eukprot:XP_001747294.1 hypothetical protein [Monosiga brevicollis MX1]
MDCDVLVVARPGVVCAPARLADWTLRLLTELNNAARSRSGHLRWNFCISESPEPYHRRFKAWDPAAFATFSNVLQAQLTTLPRQSPPKHLPGAVSVRDVLAQALNQRWGPPAAGGMLNHLVLLMLDMDQLAHSDDLEQLFPTTLRSPLADKGVALAVVAWGQAKHKQADAIGAWLRAHRIQLFNLESSLLGSQLHHRAVLLANPHPASSKRPSSAGAVAPFQSLIADVSTAHAQLRRYPLMINNHGTCTMLVAAPLADSISDHPMEAAAVADAPTSTWTHVQVIGTMPISQARAQPAIANWLVTAQCHGHASRPFIRLHRYMLENKIALVVALSQKEAALLLPGGPLFARLAVTQGPLEGTPVPASDVTSLLAPPRAALLNMDAPQQEGVPTLARCTCQTFGRLDAQQLAAQPLDLRATDAGTTGLMAPYASVLEPFMYKPAPAAQKFSSRRPGLHRTLWDKRLENATTATQNTAGANQSSSTATTGNPATGFSVQAAGIQEMARALVARGETDVSQLTSRVEQLVADAGMSDAQQAACTEALQMVLTPRTALVDEVQRIRRDTSRQAEQAAPRAKRRNHRLKRLSSTPEAESTTPGDAAAAHALLGHAVRRLQVNILLRLELLLALNSWPHLEGQPPAKALVPEADADAELNERPEPMDLKSFAINDTLNLVQALNETQAFVDTSLDWLTPPKRHNSTVFPGHIPDTPSLAAGKHRHVQRPPATEDDTQEPAPEAGSSAFQPLRRKRAKRSLNLT